MNIQDATQFCGMVCELYQTGLLSMDEARRALRMVPQLDMDPMTGGNVTITGSNASKFYTTNATGAESK
jgi:hypothetical protein